MEEPFYLLAELPFLKPIQDLSIAFELKAVLPIGNDNFYRILATDNITELYFAIHKEAISYEELLKLIDVKCSSKGYTAESEFGSSFFAYEIKEENWSFDDKKTITQTKGEN